ncbi:MAG: class IIb bacteriocin, lactobin A/cerein 7B family [Flavobacteriaceae bacterium]
MENIPTNEMVELNAEELRSVNGGFGPPGGLAYRSHAMDDFFRGVVDGLSSLWK